MKMNINFFKIAEIETKLGYQFDNKQLVVLAFIHSSYWNENKNVVPECNERLEFLGDSVLGLIVAEFLYSHFPKETEGKLSSLRSSIVDASACANFALRLNLDQYLFLGRGEKLNAGKGRISILADLFEAIIGAIYLDKGFNAAKDFFFFHFSKEVEDITLAPSRNWKAELQEYVQKRYAEPPVYEVLEEWGPAHEKNFRIAVFAKSEKLGEGAGCSKKLAQQNAASDALKKLMKK